MGNGNRRLSNQFQSHRRKNNIFADTLRRLITIDPEVQLNPEFANYKFGQYCFKELPKARTKVDQKLSDTSKEGEDLEINKIK